MGKSGAGDGAGIVRVLVDNGDYDLHDRGVIAAMTITVERLRALWPHARIGVLTEQPHVLRALLPDAEPIVPSTGGQWGKGGVAGRIDQVAAVKLIGPAALHWRAATEVPAQRLRGLRERARSQVRARINSGWEPRDSGLAPLPTVPAAVTTASLVLALGGDYLCDERRTTAHRTLNLLEDAQRLGIPTVLLGQGMGPIADPELLRRAAEVLPRADLIAVRENLRTPALLAALGVTPERVLLTGDDAIEFGYRTRRPEIAGDLGVCRHTMPLLANEPRVRPVLGRTDTAQEVARRVTRCRVLLTDAYHLAVLALSQGIPAVAVTGSGAADDKFRGLADMFESDATGAGLRIVHLGADDFDTELTRAIGELWESAPELRDTLQQRAVEQIDAGRAALERVRGLVAAGSAGRPVASATAAQGT
ncbi:polysaccharide pyruvyl transferase family protein [Nocardia jejuensis]|uniref:polysaccharide pyruvyl transferase family protein n=1 Tax=Nocardia jejuensis TaxID=328049 RepID=UPI000ADCF543|nr:polysaccharide pyruvyl transferase family protein [Nocardia jejuensis]